VKKYHIVTFDEHMSKEGFTLPEKSGFLKLDDILTSEEIKTLKKNSKLSGGLPDLEETLWYDESRSYDLDDLEPEDEVYVEVDEVSMESAIESGDTIYVEVDDDVREDESLPGFENSEPGKKKITRPFEDFDITPFRAESFDESLLKDAFLETAKDASTENAFSDAFKVSDNIFETKNKTDNITDVQKEYTEDDEEDFNFLESNASYDYNGIVPSKKKIPKKEEVQEFIIGNDKKDEHLTEKVKPFSSSETAFEVEDDESDSDDEGKKSYIERRDEEIELIRQEILKAKAGVDDKSDITLIKNILKKEKDKLTKTKTAKEVKPVRKGTFKKRKKKKRSLSSLSREVLLSAGFKISLILFGIFTFSILGIYFIERNSQGGMFKSIWDSLWYTIVTFTTFGGQIVGIFMMFVGVTLFGVVSGRIASYLVDIQIKRGKGLIKLQKLSGHFVVCGWRKDFNSILDEIIAANKDISNDEMVLINDVSLEMMEAIMSDERYRGINYIRGDFLDESVLRRANIGKANKVLILADSSHEYSPQEADSRTVMAAITIESINKNIYVCAELLDGKFERYLKLAHVEEIILTRDYSRTLLANASAANGMSHIVTELISTMSEKGLSVDDIPKEFFGDTFESLAMYYLDRDGSILIGLLENTGNFYARKKEALQEAQKTPDISKLVTNLKIVKSLTANKPVVNPGGDYIIKEHAKAIVVEGVNRSEKEAIFG
jgi:voltage-gated potassium channel